MDGLGCLRLSLHQTVKVNVTANANANATTAANNTFVVLSPTAAVFERGAWTVPTDSGGRGETVVVVGWN